MEITVGRRKAVGLFQQRGKPSEKAGVVFYDKAKEERYKRYEHAQYRNLILKSTLTFILGLFIAFLLKL